MDDVVVIALGIMKDAKTLICIPFCKTDELVTTEQQRMDPWKESGCFIRPSAHVGRQ